MSERRRVTAGIARQMINALIARPRSREDLAQAVGVATVTVSAWLREWHHGQSGADTPGTNLVRVCRWDNDSRGYPTIAVFAWDPGVPDAKKDVLTPAQRQALRRAKAKTAGAQ